MLFACTGLGYLNLPNVAFGKGKIVLKTKAQVQADKEFDNPHHGHPPEEPEAPVAKKGHINFTVKKKTEEPLPVKKGKINFTVKKKS